MIFILNNPRLTTHKQLTFHWPNPELIPYSIPAESILELWKFKLYMSQDFPDQEPSLSTILSEVRKVRELVSSQHAD